MGNLVFQATLGGQVNLVGPNTASTFNLNVPAVSSTIATTSGTETLTNKTLTSPVISGGTIDNAVIGGTTAAAGSFTTLSASSTLSVTGAGTIQGLTVGKGAGAVASNTVVGNGALASGSQSGGGNNAFGQYSLAVNTSGATNNAYGNETLYANTTGAAGAAFGHKALWSNTTGSNNVGVGYNALYSNTTADNNTAVGYQAGYSNTGGNNTFVGFQSAYTNTTGQQNLAFGLRSLYSNTTGSYNAALGYNALYSNTTASNNTAVGYQAGYSGTVAANNTFVGYQAGYANNSGGAAYNTFVGYGSGSAVTGGYKHTIIGAYTGNQGGLDIRTANNYIVLSDGDGNPQGYFQPSGNFVLTRTTFSSLSAIGCYQDTSASAANVFITSGGSFVRSTSSRKYKTDIQDATHGLAELLTLRSVTYKGTGNHDGQQVLGGLIAEEVHEAGLTEFVQYAEDGTPDALAYGHMVSLCVKAIQELKAEFDAYKEAHP